METLGPVGQCPPRVRVSGTLAGKMIQRLHVEAQVGPGTLGEKKKILNCTIAWESLDWLGQIRQANHGLINSLHL